MEKKKKKEDISKINNVYFLKWISNSCRYDTFFFIYCFAIKYFINSTKIKIELPILKLVDKIGNILIKANNNLLNRGIWEIIEKNIIPEINLTSEQN